MKLFRENSAAVFKNYGTVASCYYHQRKTIAAKLGNQGFEKTSFLHWKVTMECHRTKDILYVKELLGYEYINNTSSTSALKRHSSTPPTTNSQCG